MRSRASVGRSSSAGHTHQQFRRGAYVNAGSVGRPYEGRPGAFWLLLEDGVPELRETAYDLEAAAAELRATGAPDVEELLSESLLEPVERRRGRRGLRVRRRQGAVP